MESLLISLINLFGGLEITIPMRQIALLIAVSIFLILLGKFKTALMANLIFTFSWVCIASRSFSGEFTISNVAPFAGSYMAIASAIFFGVAVMIFYSLSE